MKTETTTMIPDEPLILTAPMARIEAEKLCRTDGTAHGSCSWYHGVWQYFRLLGVVAPPSRHADFFRDSFGSLAQKKDFANVLVTGTADYSIYAHLLSAYENFDKTPRVTVIDHCDTPLFLCRWYANYVSKKVATERVDVLDFVPARKFDVICTHSFMSKVQTRQRPALAAAWRRALRPGGKVVTNTRLKPAVAEEAPGFTQRQGAFFQSRVSAAMANNSGLVDIDADELSRMAGRFAELTESYPFQTADQVTNVFEEGGFEIETLNHIEIGKQAGVEASGPGTDRPATYLEIVARRL